VGKGATSIVMRANYADKPEKQVAIKRIKRLFDHTAYAHRAMRELRILRILGQHENVSRVTKNIFSKQH
jgi:hypothetical protein